MTVCVLRAEQELAQPLVWAAGGGGGLGLGRAPGEQSLCTTALCQPCLLLDLKCRLLTSSLVLLLLPHHAVPSAMEILVSAQAPWPPPDSWGLVHQQMGSRWTTQRLSWLPLCCACWLAVHVSALSACRPCSSPSTGPLIPLFSQLFLSCFVSGSETAVSALPQHT